MHFYDYATQPRCQKILNQDEGRDQPLCPSAPQFILPEELFDRVLNCSEKMLIDPKNIDPKHLALLKYAIFFYEKKYNFQLKNNEDLMLFDPKKYFAILNNEGRDSSFTATKRY